MKHEHIVSLPSEWAGTRTATELANNATFAQGVVQVVFNAQRAPV